MSDVDFAEMAEQADSLPPENNEAQEVQNEEPIQYPNRNDPGYSPVDLADLPPERAKEINDRFGYFFKQDKDRQRELDEFRQLAQLPSQRIEELTGGVEQVVNHLHTQSTTQREAQLEQQMQDAFDSGDSKLYVKLQTELVKLQTQREMQPKQQRQTKPQVQQSQYN